MPAVVTALPIVAIAWSRIEHCSHGHWRLGGQVTFVALLVLSPLQEGTRHIDLSGGRHPLAEIGQVATLVAENTKPDDTVLALETLGVVVDAGRQVMPGLTLAQFSLQNMDDELAKQMHVVNVGMLVNAVDRKAVQAVILTASDWGVITALNPAGAGELRNALDANCGHILSISDFGQYAHGADVFVCR